jgi:F-box and WD-40 domain protein CDC4
MYSGHLQSIKGHELLVRCLQFLDKDTVISGARDGTLRTWDMASGSRRQKVEFVGHTGEIRGLKAHGNTVVSGSYDTQVHIWNSLTGECLKTLHGHRGRVHGVEYDGIRIVTSSEYGDIRVWDPNTGYVTCPYVPSEKWFKN